MKVEATPWWGLLVGGALAAVWTWQSFTYYTFAEDARRQFNQPQLKSGESRFGRMVARLELDDLEPYQLVRFRLPRAGEVTSRIVALEGQRVRLEGGEVFVDGAPFEDRYRRGRSADVVPELVVPEGCVYVLNDVRSAAASAMYDSRGLGPVPLRAISRRFAAREWTRR